MNSAAKGKLSKKIQPDGAVDFKKSSDKFHVIHKGFYGHNSAYSNSSCPSDVSHGRTGN